MKLSIFIDKEHEEEVIVYAHEKNEIVSEIERLLNSNSTELIGFKEDMIEKLEPFEVYCFSVEGGKVYAYTENDKFHIKQRLYTLEGILPDCFIKINQSCIANINMIKGFEAAFSGSLLVRLKNGHTDYVSRRNLKNVKERLGL